MTIAEGFPPASAAPTASASAVSVEFAPVDLPRAHRAPQIAGRQASSWLRKHPLWRCLAIYRLMPVRFGLCLALFVAVNAGMAGQQHLVGRAVNELQRGLVVVRDPSGALDYRRGLLWIGVIGAVTAARGVLQYLAGVLSLMIGQDLLTHLREGILIQVQRLDLAYHVRHGVGEMVTRTTRDADKVRDALISVWRNVIETTLVLLGALGLMTFYAPLIAVGPVVAIALGLGWLLRHTESLVNLDRKVGAAFDVVNQDTTEGVHGVRVIKAFNLEPSRVARFEAAVETFRQLARQALRFAALYVPVPQIIVALGQVWVLVVGTVLVSRGRLDLGALVASLLLMNTVVFRVETVGRVMQVFADARSSAGRIMELLDAEPGIVSGRAPLPAGALGVKLEAVAVRTPGGSTDVLRDCSLTVKPGEIVALVGATGSGKSTLTALLPRLIEADAGRVSVGSDAHGWRDVRELNLSELRRRVHVVPQDIFLFSDTLAANLRLGAPDATDADLRRALTAAAADDVVAALPDGWDTVIGDRGVTLSGGQRQRLTLARAIATRPSVLVLDDSTSAVDAVTERKIFEGIRQVQGTVTLLLVASKLSTVLLADRAALLVGGRIVTEGTHEVLAREHAAYRELLGITDATHPA